MEDKKWWIGKFDDGIFLAGMFEMYLKRTKQWERFWDEVVGTKLHYRDTEWRSEYDGLDGDFVEVFIRDVDRQIISKCIVLSDFLEWQESRTNAFTGNDTAFYPNSGLSGVSRLRNKEE